MAQWTPQGDGRRVRVDADPRSRWRRSAIGCSCSAACAHTGSRRAARRRRRRSRARVRRLPDRRARRRRPKARTSTPACRWIRSPPASSARTPSWPRSSWRSNRATWSAPATRPMLRVQRLRSRGAARRRRCRWRTIRAPSSSACSAPARAPIRASRWAASSRTAAFSTRSAESVRRSAAGLGRRDRVKLDQYLDAIRDIERRHSEGEEQSARELPVSTAGRHARPASRSTRS